MSCEPKPLFSQNADYKDVIFKDTTLFISKDQG